MVHAKGLESFADEPPDVWRCGEDGRLGQDSGIGVGGPDAWGHADNSCDLVQKPLEAWGRGENSSCMEKDFGVCAEGLDAWGHSENGRGWAQDQTKAYYDDD